MVATVVLVVFLCGFYQIDNGHNKNLKQKFLLDSLQGKWVSENDKHWQWQFHGRTLDDYYIAKNIKSHEVFKVYFADRMLDQDSDFYSIHIDTAAKNGLYMITASLNDSSFWCYEVNGFYYDKYLTFSVTDTWAKRRESVFRKVNK
jgi:hypothetical protein